ncbi:uncharacterized protein LOC130589522 [Beta vulgaris subsp. vulgaris]|uniref:uncharacterized protein LOC130589522 n=1 Tax=Beta vulgaris subsp. vulgaris TaxID=3555 RepID=UPI0025466A81|nr:uncharacterized protein LOC130589522 [Beta vulgaris subsp. vulgaris]
MEEGLPIDDSFPDDKLLAITFVTPWYADFANFCVSRQTPRELSYQQRKKFLDDAKKYFCDDPLLYKLCADTIYRRCNNLILVVVNYVSKWVEAIASPTNDSKVVMKMFKKIIFPRFGVPSVVISDGGSHFHKRTFEALHKKYGIYHRTCLAYRPQTSGTAFKSPIGTTPYKLVYEKSCHLPIKLEYKAFWAVKELNLDAKLAGEKRLLQINELDELRLNVYDSLSLYKECTKRWHDKKILSREFSIGDKVLLYNSRLKLFPGKLKSRWSGAFSVTNTNKFGSTERLETGITANTTAIQDFSQQVDANSALLQMLSQGVDTLANN